MTLKNKYFRINYQYNQLLKVNNKNKKFIYIFFFINKNKKSQLIGTKYD